MLLHLTAIGAGKCCAEQLRDRRRVERRQEAYFKARESGEGQFSPGWGRDHKEALHWAT